MNVGPIHHGPRSDIPSHTPEQLLSNQNTTQADNGKTFDLGGVHPQDRQHPGSARPELIDVLQRSLNSGCDPKNALVEAFRQSFSIKGETLADQAEFESLAEAVLSDPTFGPWIGRREASSAKTDLSQGYVDNNRRGAP